MFSSVQSHMQPSLISLADIILLRISIQQLFISRKQTKHATVFVGVSCDSCNKSNFRGKRFKCLTCYDYDLCATCYENGATTTRHTADHPMQCILTRADFGMLCMCKQYIYNLQQFYFNIYIYIGLYSLKDN